jgi:two-component system response regulator GlrR
MSPHAKTRRLFIVAGEIDHERLAALADTVGGAPARWDAETPAPWRDRALDLLVIAVGPGETGAAALAVLRRQPPSAATLALVADGAAPDLLRAAAEIADDFVTWPVRRAELGERLHRLLPSAAADAGLPAPRAARAVAGAAVRLKRQAQLRQMVGEAPAFRRMVDALPRLARQEGTVLIVGETGTGKELCARAIHQMGPRAGGPFVAVDCGALPDQLLENELFGHARGAFTDARAEQRGLVSLADGGVLFLDEVDALSSVAQAKLLRFLQEHSYRPLGSDRLIQADVRVVAATNSDLGRLVREGGFRADLFFRLHVLRVDVAPLRERRADVPLLAAHFLQRLDGDGDAAGGGPRRLTARALARLRGHSWPGNVRELENVIRRALAAIAADAAEIGEGEIDAALAALSVAEAAPAAAFDRPARAAAHETFRSAKARAIADFERRFIDDLLLRHRGNITQAARAAHKDRRALGRLVKKYLAAPALVAPPLPPAPGPLQRSPPGATRA